MKYLILGAVLAFCGAIAWADDPITGGEWTVDGDNTTIVSGTCRLVGQTTTTHININAGATLVLDSDDLFTKPPVVHMDGTLDLNGHSCKILRLINLTRDDYPRAYTARIVNNADADVLVFMNSTSETAFYGKIEETRGKIAVRGPNTTFNLFGSDGAMTVSSVTNAGNSTLMPYSCPLKVRIVLQPSLEGIFNLRLGEIGLTYQGKPVPIAKAILVGEQKATNISSLIDGNATTYWRAESAAAQTIELEFANGYIPRVDGFRLTPYDENGHTRYRPGGWDVYTFRSDSAGWVLASSVRNFTGWASRQNSATTNLPFSAECRLGSVFGEKTDLTLESSSANALRVSTIDPLKTGAIRGSGGIRIENGSTLAPGSLTDYTGSFTVNACTTPDMQAKLALSSRGGAEQPVAITSRQNLAVVNGGAEPVSVLLDDSRAGSLFGRLADGTNGSLGLVKRGSGTRVLETEDATYTGETKVAEGTLVVARMRTAIGTMSAKYLRFTPLTTVGSDASYPWAANELQLLDAEGAVIAWPTGTTAAKPSNTANEHSSSRVARLVDGNTTTRMLMPPYSDSTTGFAPITVTLPTAVSFAGYRWVSTRENSADKRRTPLTWRLEVSEDGASWRTCDLGEQAWSTDEDSAAWGAGNEGFARTVAAVGGSVNAAVGTGLVTLGETLLKKSGDRATVGELEARYFRFRVLDVESTTAHEVAYGWQLAEIGLMKDGRRVDWPERVSVTLAGGSLNAYNNSKLENLVNNVIWEEGKGSVNQTRESAFIQEYPSSVTIDAGEPMRFDAYSLVGLKTYWYRMPSAWTFEISADGTNWTLADAVGGHALTLEQRNKGDGYPEMGPFALRYPLLDRGAGNSIGDASPVSIAEGATLRLATDYEKFGALSGAGALDLEFNAVGEIATDAATFSGDVTGSGTLILSGDGTQFFDDADLTGVKTLVFDGGAIGGSATFGALDVTGEVRYELAMTAEEIAKGSCTRQIITATSLTEGAKTVLAAGTLKTPLPSRGWKLTVVVTDTTVTVKARRNGLVVVLR